MVVEGLPVHKLGDDLDERGNLLKEIEEGKRFEEAFWQLDKARQEQSSPYFNLIRKIEDLPKFERSTIKIMIIDFINNYPKEEQGELKETGIVQLMGYSSRPLQYWQECSFNTPDKKFEEFLDNKIRPAVEGMLEDLNK